MNYPCQDCPTRKWYARAFDIHFSGEDCFYICEEYENWKKEQEEPNENSDLHGEQESL